MNTNSLSKNPLRRAFSTINGRKMPPLRRLQMKRVAEMNSATR